MQSTNCEQANNSL